MPCIWPTGTKSETEEIFFSLSRGFMIHSAKILHFSRNTSSSSDKYAAESILEETTVSNNIFPLLLSRKRLYCQWRNYLIIYFLLSICFPPYCPLYIGHFYCLCLQIEWQLSQRRKTAVVLGSPERNFVIYR